MQLFRQLTRLFRRKQLEDSMVEEIRLHLEHRITENLAAGMDPAEARYTAERKFGNVAQVLEQARIQRGWDWSEQLGRDLGSAARSLLRARGFTAMSILSLALGMGSAAAIFSVADRIIFSPAKFPEDVLLIGGQNDNVPSMPYRWDYMARAYESQTQILSDFSKTTIVSGNIVLDGQPVDTAWNGVSANFFLMLGIHPLLGRGFRAGEDVEGFDQVVVISHKFWQERMGGRPDVLGQKITVGQAPCVVVGVLRKAQALPAFCPNEIFRPLTYQINPQEPWQPYLYLLGRLKSEVSREQAQQVLRTVKIDVPAPAQPYYFNDRPLLSSLTEVNQYHRPEIYWLMLGAVGFLHAIACLNASNLMLARFLSRHRELGIRLALGGSRWRIARLLVVESALLAAFASLAGMPVANWLLPLLPDAGVSPPRAMAWNLDVRVFGALAVLAVTSCLTVVALPVFRLFRSEISSGLKDFGGSSREGPVLVRLRGALVVIQAAFAIILLAGAGLMIHTIHRLQEVDLGFDPADRMKVQLGFPPDYPFEAPARLARLREIQAELLKIPGVRATGFGMDIMLPGYYVPTYIIDGSGGRAIKAACLGFGIGYQDASGLILKRGHWLNQTMGPEVMVNESFARACWPNEDPIGKFVRPMAGSPAHGPGWKGWVVAGVVGDVRSTVRERTENYFYGPEGWGPSDFKTFVVRGSNGNSGSLSELIRRQLYAFDPRITVDQITAFDALRDNNLWAERLTDSVLKVLAGIALILTVVGLFSVLTYTVERRLAEFGVRLALGATRRHLAGLVVHCAMRLTLAGIALGYCTAIALTRYLESLLFETTPNNPWVLGAVGALVLITATTASILPALRAVNADVTRLLKSE